MDERTLRSLDKILDDEGLEDGQTISEYILAKAALHARAGRSYYIVDGLTDERRYFKDLEPESRKVGSHFYKKGLRKGDVVVYVSNSQIKQNLLLLGVWRANGVARSLHAEDEPGSLLEKVMEVKARWIFCDSAQLELCLSLTRKVSWPMEVIVTSEEGSGPGTSSFTEYLQDDGSALPALETCQSDLALILPTSGTTGKSKGAAITHRGLLIQCLAGASVPWTYPKPNLLASKGTHVSGTILPWGILIAGCTTIVLSKVSKENILKTVDKYKPGVVHALPTFLTVLTSPDAKGFDLLSIEYFFVGGCVISPALKKSYRSLPNVKDVVTIYGLTEGLNQCTSADVVSNLPAIHNYKDVPDLSIGKPFGGVSIQIRDLDALSLEPHGPHEVGELCTKGDNVFSGYYLNPEVTKEAFTEDGWFRTGDVGYYDLNGYVYLVDRKKDIFKFRGYHVSPSEIEDIILEHDWVNEACVVSVPDPNNEGELPRAFITIKSQRTSNKEDWIGELGQEVETFANDKLANYKQLRGGVYIVKELPKGKTGKVVRSLVAQLKPI